MRLPLDQNFPEPILGRMEPWMGDIQLVPLRMIDRRLPRSVIGSCSSCSNNSDTRAW